jgi:hypothetical protein
MGWWGKRLFKLYLLVYFTCITCSRKKFSRKRNSESRPHSSPDPSCGREISRGKAKNPFPQKKRFSLCRVRIEAPRTARILGGQNPERKTPFPFSKEISPPPNQKCKECFFFRGCWCTRQCVGLSPSVRFSFASPRAPRVPHHLFWK